MSDVIDGAVDALRMLKDGTMAVTLHFAPGHRKAVMEMMGEPGASIACARLKDGHAAVPASPAPRKYIDLGPLCREAIELCTNETFQQYATTNRGKKLDGVSDLAAFAKNFICITCNVESRKELDTADGARELFIAHIRKPFHAWLEKNPA